MSAISAQYSTQVLECPWVALGPTASSSFSHHALTMMVEAASLLASSLLLHHEVEIGGCHVKPNYELCLDSIFLYFGLRAMSTPLGPCCFKTSKLASRLIAGQYRPTTCSWKWSQCHPQLGKLQQWIDKVFLGPKHPLRNTRMSFPIFNVRTGVFVQNHYHGPDLPSNTFIFWSASLSGSARRNNMLFMTLKASLKF